MSPLSNNELSLTLKSKRFFFRRSIKPHTTGKESDPLRLNTCFLIRNEQIEIIIISHVSNRRHRENTFIARSDLFSFTSHTSPFDRLSINHGEKMIGCCPTCSNDRAIVFLNEITDHSSTYMMFSRNHFRVGRRLCDVLPNIGRVSILLETDLSRVSPNHRRTARV